MSIKFRVFTIQTIAYAHTGEPIVDLRPYDMRDRNFRTAKELLDSLSVAGMVCQKGSMRSAYTNVPGYCHA